MPYPPTGPVEGATTVGVAARGGAEGVAAGVLAVDVLLIFLLLIEEVKTEEEYSSRNVE
jgi:hypothetical protein